VASDSTVAGSIIALGETSDDPLENGGLLLLGAARRLLLLIVYELMPTKCYNKI
jgi:hypothetical protein